jgi:hypothetical protein
MSINPTIHEVCSSDFVSDDWNSQLSKLTKTVFDDWVTQSTVRLDLLSNFCQTANSTVLDAVSRFMARSFIGSNLLTDADFNAQLANVFVQFIVSTSNDYSRLIDIVRLITQVDQFYTGYLDFKYPSFNAAVTMKKFPNETITQSWFQVCHRVKARNVPLASF